MTNERLKELLESCRAISELRARELNAIIMKRRLRVSTILNAKAQGDLDDSKIDRDS